MIPRSLTEDFTNFHYPKVEKFTHQHFILFLYIFFSPLLKHEINYPLLKKKISFSFTFSVDGRFMLIIHPLTRRDPGTEELFFMYSISGNLHELTSVVVAAKKRESLSLSFCWSFTPLVWLPMELSPINTHSSSFCPHVEAWRLFH